MPAAGSLTAVSCLWGLFVMLDQGLRRQCVRAVCPSLSILECWHAVSPSTTQVPFSAGVWATLQFKWVQVQYPVVVLAFEKLVLGCCLPVAAVLDT